LPCVTGGAEKEHHHRCTKDELHFNSPFSASRTIERTSQVIQLSPVWRGWSLLAHRFTKVR
jgi:hypothetical protein